MNARSSAPYTLEFYENLVSGSRRSAEVVVPLVLERMPVQSVVDVGCGTGTWLSVFSGIGVERVHGIDGEWVTPAILEIPPRCFSRADLTRPLLLDEEFDLVVSLEVAEHLPPASAAGFVESLIRLGPVVLFSAAIPHQGGQDHRNEQWPSYWWSLFASHGYQCVDLLRPLIWHDDRVEWWYRQNVLLFVEASRLVDYPYLKAEGFARSPAALVHPQTYLEAQVELDRVRRIAALEPGAVRASEIAGALPRLLVHGLIAKLERWRTS
jgi:SAM-dependent methyltransferase